MNEKTIKEVVEEFKSEFGLVEFKATNFETGQVGGSKDWKDQRPAQLEIDGADYLALGKLNANNEAPTEGVIINLLRISRHK